MAKVTEPKIVVSVNGPYLVSGNVPVGVQTIVPNTEGFPWDWAKGRTFETTATYALCRCGHSKNKPFCDGSHAKVRFDGRETASRQPYVRQAEASEGPARILLDAEGLCAFARFCDPGGKIWSLVGRSDDPAAKKLVDREAEHCPSGRLVVLDKLTGKAIEPPLSPSIGVIEDPAMECSGPLWVRGGIRVESADGKAYEVRHRVTLCRCGASNNKPFCNGSHASIKFQDGLR
ncbi:MAG: CDGSH iron-sulfur domain-containing protein [Thermoplasmata archaeon]